MKARLFVALAISCVGAPLAAQLPTHVLVVTGLPGEPQYAATFNTAGDGIVEAARTRWGVKDSSLIYLADDPARDPSHIRGRSTRESIAGAFAALAKRAAPGDAVLIVLIGHGSGDGPESRLNVSGPDPVARDYAAWLGALAKQQVVVVVAASGSGDFLAALSGPNRVVITATKAASERNESQFAELFARGLATDEADLDKDGRISALEAYGYARAAVRKRYEEKKTLLTEHAQLDDDGDGKGSDDPSAAGATDGLLARRISFGRASAASDPRVAALLVERQELEGQVTALRQRKATSDSTTYAAELERLLLLIAEKTQAIRALQPAAKP